MEKFALNKSNKWLKTATTMLVAGTLFLSTISQTFAFTVTDIKVTLPKNIEVIKTITGQPQSTKLAITNVIVSEPVTTPSYSQSIQFCSNTDAYFSVGIAESLSTGNLTVKNLLDNALVSTTCKTVYWDGKYSNGENAKGDGKYYYWIEGQNKYNANDTVLKTDWITYKGQTSTSSTSNEDDEEDLIKDLKVKPVKFDPYDNEDVEITFKLTKDAEVSVKIYDSENDKLVTTLEEKEDLDRDTYEYNWDGEDDESDIVADGKYYVKVKAETDSGQKDIDKEDIKVKEGSGSDTTETRLRDVFVSKASFDPAREETTFLVFTTTSQSDVKVSVYEGNDEITVLYDKNDVEAGTFAIAWDGTDRTGDTVKANKNYTLKVTTENNKSEDSSEETVKVEDDEEWSKLPNVYNDKTSPVVFKPEYDDSKMTFKFKMQQDADVSIIVYDNGNDVAHVFDSSLDQGTNSIKWNGEDDEGNLLKDGVYDYKIIAENYSGESKEWGKFMISDSYKQDFKKICGGFRDVTEDSSYCDSVKWAQENDVLEGYDDGTFRPYQTINRVETLKAVLLMLGFSISDDNGSNLGFNDVTPGAWYVKYIRTGKLYGIVHGYGDGSFKPEKQVTKAEALVMMLNAAKVRYSLVVPACTYKPYPDVASNAWYTDSVCYAKYYELTEDDSYFYPSKLLTRGEMAELLYNFYKSGALN